MNTQPINQPGTLLLAPGQGFLSISLPTGKNGGNRLSWGGKLLLSHNFILCNGPRTLQTKQLRILGVSSNSQFWYVNFLATRASNVAAKFAAPQKKYTFSLLGNYLRNYKGNKCMIAFFFLLIH